MALFAWKLPIVELMMTASRNVVRRLKRLETVQVIEHSVLVNACKNILWQQLLLITSYKGAYQEEYEILNGTPSKFYPSPRT